MKILVADANLHNRENLASYLKQNGLDVVGTTSSGRQFLDQVQQMSAEIVLLDINLQNGGTIELTKQLTSLQHAPTVIILMISFDPEIEQSGLQAGAYACLAKNDGIDPIINTIQKIQSDLYGDKL